MGRETLLIYMDKKNNNLKVGRISSKVEKGLSLSLFSDSGIYLNEAFLNELASKRPKTYPDDIEKIISLIKKPDFVFSSKKEKELIYAKTYIKDSSCYFLLLTLKRVGKPKKWCASSLRYLKLEDCGYILKEYKSLRF